RRRPSLRPDADPSPSVPPVAEDASPPLASHPEASAEAPLDLESTRAEAPTAKRSERPPPGPSKAPLTPPGREQLLERLRARSKALDPTAVQRILEQRRRDA